jgi:large subunit ribosomal protein L24
MLICPSCKQATRVGVTKGDDGKNVRYCKKCERVIPRPDAG